MRVSDDKQKYLAYYFDNIHFLNGLQISAVEDMAQFKGQGAEYISCCYDSEDEDYKEGYVTLLFWKPADDEDTMVFVDNIIFYEKLLEVCNDHIAKNPHDKELLNRNLNQIKKDLRV
ncbi:hypothetical protein FACS189418_1310 [Clostridia bacterium]|nr:hypothetical protein FACS189418_1310 [Clostridia bacterium]